MLLSDQCLKPRLHNACKQMVRGYFVFS